MKKQLPRENIRYDHLSVWELDFEYQAYNSRYTPGHWHPEFELAYVLQGQVHYSMDGETFQLGQGEAFFVNSGRPHSSSCSLDCKSRILIFDASIFSGIPFLHGSYIKKLVDCRTSHLFMQGDVAERVGMLLADISRSKHRYGNAGEFETLGSLCKIMEMLLQIIPYAEDNEERAFQQGKAMQKMLHFIDDHYTENLRVEDIADAVPISRTTCNTLFREYLQISPIEHLICYRIEKSKELLLQEEAISEIADQCGFHSVTYYCTVFRKREGMSPGAYRRKARKAMNTGLKER